MKYPQRTFTPMRSIQVSELKDYVTKMHENKDQLFIQEFKVYFKVFWSFKCKKCRRCQLLQPS